MRWIVRVASVFSPWLSSFDIGCVPQCAIPRDLEVSPRAGGRSRVEWQMQDGETCGLAEER